MALWFNGEPNKHFNVNSKALPALLERSGLHAFTAAARFTLVLGLSPPSKQSTKPKGNSEEKPVVGLGQGSKFQHVRSSADFGNAGSTKTEHDTAGCYFRS